MDVRDLSIGLFEKLIGGFVIFLCLGGMVGTVGVFLAPAPNGGPLVGVAILVGGSIYAILMGGIMYLF